MFVKDIIKCVKIIARPLNKVSVFDYKSKM